MIDTARFIAASMLPKWLCMLFCLAVTLISTSSVLSAQVDTAGRWSLWPMRVEGPLADVAPLVRPEYFFLDSLRGFRRIDTVYNRTSDGGRTWSDALPHPVTMPHRMLDDSFGIGRTTLTSDGGVTWRGIVVETNARYPAIEAAAYSARRWAALYRDSLGFYRLAYTTDGGEKWNRRDTVVPVIIDGKQYHEMRSDFGDFPVTPEMTNVVENRWNSVIGYLDSNTVLLASRVRGTFQGGVKRRYFLGRANLATEECVWSEIVPDHTSRFDEPQFSIDVSADTLYVKILMQHQDGQTSMENILMRSDDGGGLWRTVSMPEWLDIRTLRFFSADTGIASNGHTYTAGDTWIPRGHPFHFYLWGQNDNPGFQAVSPTHYFVSHEQSLLASTSDAGRSWRRSATAATPWSVAAHNGRVIVGRQFQSLMVSSDSGETWRDRGLDGGLPLGLSTVHLLAFPDTAGDPARVIGLGAFVGYDGVEYVATINSTDGGNTWSEGMRLPEYDSLFFREEALRTFRVSTSFINNGGNDGRWFIASSGGLRTSDDRGASWQLVSTLPLATLVMLDKERGFATRDIPAVDTGGIVMTDNGGKEWGVRHEVRFPRNVATSAFAADQQHLRVIFPDLILSSSWNVVSSDDGGNTWQSRQGGGTASFIERSLATYWVDTLQIYMIGQEAKIQYSNDGGRSVRRLVDTQSELPGSAAIGFDGRYIYQAGANNRFGRYRLFESPLSAVPLKAAGEVRVALAENPVRGNEIELRVSQYETAASSVVLYDLLGNARLRSVEGVRGAGEYVWRLNVGELPQGNYMAHVRVGGGMSVVPVVLVR